MADYLTEDEYKVLQSDLRAGNARLFVTRSLSRQFFINVANRNVRDLTGVSLIGEKFLVLSLLVAAIGLITTCLVLLITEFGWAAMFAVPLTGIFWTIIVGFTTEAGSMLLSSILLVLCMVLSYFFSGDYGWLFTSFIVSVYCYRIAHLLAQNFLITLVASSYDAYEMLSEQIEVAQDAA